MPKRPMIEIGENTDDDLTNLFSRSVRRNSRPQRLRPPSPFEGFLSRREYNFNNLDRDTPGFSESRPPLFEKDTSESLKRRRKSPIPKEQIEYSQPATDARGALMLPGHMDPLDRGSFRQSFKNRERASLERGLDRATNILDDQHASVAELWQSKWLGKYLDSPRPARRKIPSRLVRFAKLIPKVLK